MGAIWRVMKEMNERFFLLSEIENYLKDNISLFIFGNGEEEREAYLRNIFIKYNRTQCKVLGFNYKEEEFYIDDSSDTYQLKRDIMDFINNSIKDNPKRILIDITSLSLPIFAYLLQKLKEMNCIEVFCSYTEPKYYIKKKISEISEERFDLFEEFIGIKPLPGFLRSDKMNRKTLLTLFLGFEGRRANYIFNEVNPQEDCTIPVIGLPAFQPGWQNYTYECNINFLNESDTTNFTEYISAYSPFKAYNLLKRIKVNYPDQYLLISPIGTKAHALGAALFAIENPDCSIIYDNPIYNRRTRSKGIGKSYIYDISPFLNL